MVPRSTLDLRKNSQKPVSSSRFWSTDFQLLFESKWRGVRSADFLLAFLRYQFKSES